MSGEPVDQRSGFARHPLTITIVAGLLSLIGVATGLYIDYRSDHTSPGPTNPGPTNIERTQDQRTSVYQAYLAVAYAYRGDLVQFVTKNQSAITDAVHAEVDSSKVPALTAYADVLNKQNPTARANYLRAYGLVGVYGSVQANAVARNVDAAIYPPFVLPGKVDRTSEWYALGCGVITNQPACSLLVREQKSQTLGTPDAEFYGVRVAAFQNLMCTEIADRKGTVCASPSPSTAKPAK
jgi:hypothetical protein